MVCILSAAKQKSENFDNNSAEGEQKDDRNMDVDVDETSSADDGLILRTIAGGNLIQQTPLYSQDEEGEFLYIAENNVLHVYSTSTGEWVRDFEKTHTDIVSFQYDFQNQNILIACTITGELYRWKTDTGKVESKGNLNVRNGTEILSFNLLDIWTTNDTPYALITFRKHKGDFVQWKIVDINTGHGLNCPVDFKLKTENVKVIAEISKFHYFAIAQNHFVFLVNYKNWNFKKFFNAKRTPITVLKAHPTEELIATGDSSGRIFLWREFYNDTYPHTTIYPWHHTAVTAIEFSNSGKGFYSSGEERVLVQWNIDRPDLKNFVPRMAAIIVQIAVGPNNKTVAVCTADNGIQILGAENKAKCTLQNFTYVVDDKTHLDKFPIGLKVNPRTNCIVLNGRIGHLQFYSTYTKSLLYNLDVIVQNRLSRESDKILYDIRVTHTDFNLNWMATGEIYDDQEHLPELRLKFWEYQKESQNYALNTNVELPHEGGFRAIQFSNSSDVENLLCVTAGLDNVIKVWALEESDNIYKQGKIWYCVAQTSYKNLPVHSINFSQDGSLLCAGFGNNLCVYKAANLKFKTVLTAPSGVDGTLQKVVVALPKEGGKSKNVQNDENSKILKLFTSLLENCEQTLFKEIKKDGVRSAARRLIHKTEIDSVQQEKLYKQILSKTELNLFQKVLIYQKLGIFCSQSKNGLSSKFRQNNINSEIMESVLQSKLRKTSLKDRFKAKNRINKLSSWQRVCQSEVDKQLIPLFNVLQIRGKSNAKPQRVRNGSAGINGKTAFGDSLVPPPVQGIAQIKKVLFGSGEYAHLVIVCTQHRVLIWNLLSLKLQSVLKLSVDHVTIDPLTNLIAAFTTNRELYVFLPNTPMPLYHRKNLPVIYGVCWIPRRYPKTQSLNIDWQTTSVLYFLNDQQKIMCLASEDDTEVLESSGAILSEPSESKRYSTFGAFAANQMNGKRTTFQHGNTTIGVPGKSAVKSFLDMAAHTMPRLNLMCNEFLKSMVVNMKTPESEEKPVSTHSRATEQNSSPDSDDESGTASIRKAIDEKSKELALHATKSAHNSEVEQRLRMVVEEAIDFEF